MSKPVKMRRTHFEQMLSYAEHRNRGVDGGWYYGRKDQFEKRHTEIVAWLREKILEGLRDA